MKNVPFLLKGSPYTMAFSPLTDLIVWRLKGRLPRLQRMTEAPMQVQQEQFRLLMRRGSQTEYGQTHRMTEGLSIEAFQERVPVVNYESLTPWIERTMKGEQGNLVGGGRPPLGPKRQVFNHDGGKVPEVRHAIQVVNLRGAAEAQRQSVKEHGVLALRGVEGQQVATNS